LAPDWPHKIATRAVRQPLTSRRQQLGVFFAVPFPNVCFLFRCSHIRLESTFRIASGFRLAPILNVADRPSETPCQPAGGLRSEKERSVEAGQQEWPDRRAQAGGVVAHPPTQAGLPRRAWVTHLKRVGAELSDHHPGCHPRDESDQSSVPQLGHSLQRHHGLTLHGIGQNGWPRSWNQECGCEPNGSISNWMGCNPCGWSATRTITGEAQASCREVAGPDSFHRTLWKKGESFDAEKLKSQAA